MNTERSLPEVPTLPLLATGPQMNYKETGNVGTNPYLVKHKMALSVLFRATKCPTKTHVPQLSLHGAVAQFWFMRPNWKAAVILGSLASLIQGQPLPPPSFFFSILPGMQIWHWRESCLKEYEATAWEWKTQFKDGRANGWELGQWWFPGGIHRTAPCYSLIALSYLSIWKLLLRGTVTEPRRGGTRPSGSCWV